MTDRLQKLELSWIGKEKRPRLEPRILLEDAALTHHAAFRRTDSDIYDNKLIFGDNLLALKALEQEYTGRVKCVFIDPPYNTGSAFEHYDDGLEHSIWLGLMRDRLELLKRLLSDDGSIWITIDDNEAHYLKVLCDEVFGRKNFLTDIAWWKRTSPANDAKFFSNDIDHILVYVKNIDAYKINRLPRGDSQNSYYKNPDNDPRGSWNSITYTGNKTKEERPNLYYGIKNPNTGDIVFPPHTLTWRYGKETHAENENQNLLYWGKDGKSNCPRLKMFLKDASDVVPRTVWLADDAGSTQIGMTEQKALHANPFGTPKPERLLQRILTLATNPGDLVLDSFAGSGTTGAVAQKMGRRWIMIELGEHCHTHIIPRLKKVIDDQDQGGISKAVSWTGGGGFRYYRLAPSLLLEDAHGFAVINPAYNPAMLAEAMCQLMGFRYQPSETVYWQHGRANENAYIYVTTQTLETAALAALAAEVGPERSLLICCKAFRGSADQWGNLILNKIPKAVLAKCEWGHDDYSLNIKNLPMLKPEPVVKEKATIGPTLFDQLGDEK